MFAHIYIEKISICENLEQKMKQKFKEMVKMGSKEFLEWCTEEVVNYFNTRVDKTDDKVLTEDDVFVVWSCKTLQNAKALLSTTVSDGMYYECTYNGDREEMYLDAYKKWENICIKE